MFTKNMDEAFIIVSIITTVGMILTVQLYQHNFYKREKFKFGLDTEKKKFDLQFKKLRRDMGLDGKSPAYSKTPGSPIENIGGLLNLVKGLDSEKIGALAGLLGQGQEDDGEAPGMAENLIETALQNPKIVDGITKFLNQNKTGEGAINEGEGFI